MPELLHDDLATLLRERLDARQPRGLPERFVPPAPRRRPHRLGAWAVAVAAAFVLGVAISALLQPGLGRGVYSNFTRLFGLQPTAPATTSPATTPVPGIQPGAPSATPAPTAETTPAPQPSGAAGGTGTGGGPAGGPSSAPPPPSGGDVVTLPLPPLPLPTPSGGVPIPVPSLPLPPLPLPTGGLPPLLGPAPSPSP